MGRWDPDHVAGAQRRADLRGGEGRGGWEKVVEGRRRAWNGGEGHGGMAWKGGEGRRRARGTDRVGKGLIRGDVCLPVTDVTDMHAMDQGEICGRYASFVATYACHMRATTVPSPM